MQNFPVYVISLARATDRRRAICEQLDAVQGVSYEIVDAVDGSTLNLADYQHRLRQDLCRAHYSSEMSVGEIGCFLSHYNLWQRMVDEQTPYALIMEDDAVCADDLFESAAALPEVGWQWDVVLIGYVKRKHKAKVLCEVTPGRKLVRYRRPAWLALAYLMSLDGAKKMLKQCYEIRGGLDGVWREYWINQIAFYHLDPPAVYSADGESTIDSFGHRKDTIVTLPPLQRFRRKLLRKYKGYRLQWYHLTHPPQLKS